MRSTAIRMAARDEAQEACARVYFPHRLVVLHDPAAFGMALSAVSLGAVSAGLLAYAGEVRLETGELETGYEVNVPLDGALRTRSGSADVCAMPDTAAVYRPDGRATLHGWAGGGRLFGLKIERAALAEDPDGRSDGRWWAHGLRAHRVPAPLPRRPAGGRPRPG